MIILDTNVVSELMKSQPDKKVQYWLQQSGSEALAVTVITIAEIEYGLQRLPDGKRKSDLAHRFEMFLEAFAVLALEDVAAREAGKLRALREREGLPSQSSDMMIAGIASIAGAALATKNVKDFTSLPIELFNPWQKD